jgi:hypothetical protein
VTDQPTNAEIARRLDEAIRAVERLATTLESSYVRKEVYEARHEAIRREHAAGVKEVADDVADLKRQQQDNANRWKQFAFALSCAIILLLIQGALSVANFMARTSGGG